MRSQCLAGGYILSLNHYDQERCCTIKPNAWQKILRRVYATRKFGLDKNLRTSFIIFESEGHETRKLCLAKSVLAVLIALKWLKRSDITFICAIHGDDLST